MRCWWCGDDPMYVAYHDDEWGVPLRDDARLFEKVCLEGFQAGLSWLTILRKRDAFRRAFADFAPERVARFDEDDVARLLADPAIVRHRGKIESAIGNARRALDLIEERGSLHAHLIDFLPEPAPAPQHPEDLLPVKPASAALAKDLKRRGWRFVGPTTMHAFMQSVGMVNEHLAGCASRTRVGAMTFTSA